MNTRSNQRVLNPHDVEAIVTPLTNRCNALESRIDTLENQITQLVSLIRATSADTDQRIGLNAERLDTLLRDSSRP